MNNREYKIIQIREADYGCEEIKLGEKVKVLVTLMDIVTEEKLDILAIDEELYENNVDEGSIVKYDKENGVLQF